MKTKHHIFFLKLAHHTSCTIIAILVIVAITESTAITVQKSAFNISCFSGINIRTPLSSFKSHWRPYKSVSFGADLPVVNARNIFVRFGIDAGKMSSSTDVLPLLIVIRPSFLAGYRHKILPFFSISPLAGITSTLVNPDTTIYINDKPFSSSESEFGVSAGLEPALYLKQFHLFTPILFEKVFSLPSNFNSFSIGLLVGCTF